jgi:hypothetical protein
VRKSLKQLHDPFGFELLGRILEQYQTLRIELGQANNWSRGGISVTLSADLKM